MNFNLSGRIICENAIVANWGTSFMNGDQAILILMENQALKRQHS